MNISTFFFGFIIAFTMVPQACDVRSAANLLKVFTTSFLAMTPSLIAVIVQKTCLMIQLTGTHRLLFDSLQSLYILHPC